MPSPLVVLAEQLKKRLAAEWVEANCRVRTPRGAALPEPPRVPRRASPSHEERTPRERWLAYFADGALR